MFGKVPVFENDPGFLRDLADRMQDAPGAGGDNPELPSGFTYLGQFVDHDITPRDYATSERLASTSTLSTGAGPTTSPTSTTRMPPTGRSC
jgi:hypothetical protein